ncbi:MAG: glycerol-3-phosphate 1-O-acyltransferase [Solirubrobacterales bacterium]|nr:glycerol-3-phosphate 1-O-acyltransferase [Solirubrobacterales bacterium]
MSSSLLADVRFRAALAEVAERSGTPAAAVERDAAACLAEMESSQQVLARAVWARWATYLYSRAYTLSFDAEALERIRVLGRDHPLVFLPSHRSNLDGYVMASLLHQQGFACNHTLGGINMAFWPIGPLGRRSGVIWIRRSFRDDEVYKLTLRHYVAHLAREGRNLEWYIEGGRTRTGKLLPPKLGLFNYVADAVEDLGAEGVHVIPTSIVYDELPEVEEMTTESHGAAKPAEGLGWLLRFARQQRGDYGNVQVNFGEPIALADALAAAGSSATDRSARRLARHKVAIEVCARINRATPATATSLLTLALLGVEDRALTFRQVQDVLTPVLRYVLARELPADDAARRLTTQDGVRETLQTLVTHGVVDRFDGGTESVFGIGAEQALVAGFYRNISIHWFVDRAIVELALLRAAEEPGDDVVETAWDEAFRLRDLLKFDFFFSGREESRQALTAEIELIEAGWRGHGREHLADIGPAMLRSGALMAPRILRSFIETHLIVADRLCALGEWPADPAQVAQDCLGLGEQYLKQRRITSRDAVSLHLFDPAVKLCANYGLLAGEHLIERRAEHAAYLHALQRRLGAAVDLHHASLADALTLS